MDTVFPKSCTWVVCDFMSFSACSIWSIGPIQMEVLSKFGNLGTIVNLPETLTQLYCQLTMLHVRSNVTPLAQFWWHESSPVRLIPVHFSEALPDKLGKFRAT